MHMQHACSKQVYQYHKVHRCMSTLIIVYPSASGWPSHLIEVLTQLVGTVVIRFLPKTTYLQAVL